MWRCHLQSLPAEVTAVASKAEGERAGRRRREHDRRDLLATAAARRVVLAGYVGQPAAELALDTTCRHCGAPHGKPNLPDHPALDFSTSRAGGWALVAVTSNAVVGVDVEAVDRAWEELAPGCLDGTETSALDRLPGSERRRSMARIWTRKEAVAKATGWGLAADLAAIVVPSGEHGEPIVSALPAGWGAPGEWALTDVDPAEDLPATVAVRGRCQEIRRFNLVPAAGTGAGTAN